MGRVDWGGTLFLQSLSQLTTLKRIHKLKIGNHRHLIRGMNLPKLLTLGILPIDVISEPPYNMFLRILIWQLSFDFEDFDMYKIKI